MEGSCRSGLWSRRRRRSRARSCGRREVSRCVRARGDPGARFAWGDDTVNSAGPRTLQFEKLFEHYRRLSADASDVIAPPGRPRSRLGSAARDRAARGRRPVALLRRVGGQRGRHHLRGDVGRAGAQRLAHRRPPLRRQLPPGGEHPARAALSRGRDQRPHVRHLPVPDVADVHRRRLPARPPALREPRGPDGGVAGGDLPLRRRVRLVDDDRRHHLVPDGRHGARVPGGPGGGPRPMRRVRPPGDGGNPGCLLHQGAGRLCAALPRRPDARAHPRSRRCSPRRGVLRGGGSRPRRDARGGLLGDGRRAQSHARAMAAERRRDGPRPRDPSLLPPLGLAARPGRYDALRLPLLRARAGHALPCSAETRRDARAAPLARRAGAVARVPSEAAASADALAALPPLRARVARPRGPRHRRGARGGAAMAPRRLLGVRRGTGGVGVDGSADARPALDGAPVRPQRGRELSGRAPAEAGVLGLLAHHALRLRDAVCADDFPAVCARREDAPDRGHREERLRDTLDHSRGVRRDGRLPRRRDRHVLGAEPEGQRATAHLAAPHGDRETGRALASRAAAHLEGHPCEQWRKRREMIRRPALVDVVTALGLVTAALALRLRYWGGYGLSDDSIFLGEVRQILVGGTVAPDNQAYRFTWWLPTAVFCRLFGMTEVSMVLPYLIYSLVGIALVYGFGRRLFGRFGGLAAGLMVVVHPTDVRWATLIANDFAFSVFALLTFRAALAATDEPHPERRAWLWAASALCLWLCYHSKVTAPVLAVGLAGLCLSRRDRLAGLGWFFTTALVLFGASALVSYVFAGTIFGPLQAELKFQGLLHAP